MKDRIAASVSEIATVAEEALRKALDRRIDDFDSKFSSVREESAKAVLADLRKSVAKDGFNISVPAINPPRVSVNVSSSELVRDVIWTKTTTKTTTKTKRVEQEGFWGGLKRKAGWLLDQDDWGYDDVTYKEKKKEKRYFVDVHKAEAQITAGMGKKFNGLGALAAERVEDAVEDSVEAFFSELRAKVGEIRQDFLQSKRDKELSREDRERLRTTLGGYLRDAKDAAADSNGLRDDVDALRSQRDLAAGQPGR